MRNAIMTCVLAGVLVLAVAAQTTDPVAVLQSNASIREKMDACREIARQVTREAIPVLESLLVDEELSHMARYALEPMPYSEAGEALRDALGKTSGRLKVGIVNSLAARGDMQAVPELIGLLSGDDAEVAQAAARALGTIAPPEATKALEDALARANLPPGNLRALCDGLFDCAEKSVAKGQRDQAIAIYDRLVEVPDTPRQVRTAALRGAVLTRGGEEGLPLLLEAFRAVNEDSFTDAILISRELGGAEAVTAALAAELPALPAERQVRLLDVLGQRGGQAAGPAVLAHAEDGPIEVRVAALRALSRMGYRPALALMARLAWTEEGELSTVARNSLSYFPGPERSTAIKDMLGNRDPKARSVAIELIGQGGLENPVDLLIEAAETDEDEAVRVAALKALKDCAGIDAMPRLLDRLLSARSEPEMQAAEGALNALFARQKRTSAGNVVIQEAVYGALPDGPSADVTEQVAQIVASGSFSVDASNGNFGDPAPGLVKRLRVDYVENGVPVSSTVGEGETLRLTTASMPPEVVEALRGALAHSQGESKLAVLRLLGSTGSREAFDTLLAAASGDEGAVKETALRELCGWPTSDALPTIMGLIQSTPEQTLKVLALRGAVRLLKQNAAGTPGLLEQYAVLMDRAGADEKKLVLSGLAQVADAGAFEMALCQLADESVKAEAAQTAVAIAANLGAAAAEDPGFFNGKDLAGWQGHAEYWRFEDGAIVGQSDGQLKRNDFIWSGVEVRDFYLAVDVKLDPNTGNGGIQFRSKKVDEYGQAQGYQADMGQDVWGRLYHEHGRGKLDWNGRAEAALVPGEWNRIEILAVGPSIWTAINGKLGVAFLDAEGKDERSGLVAFQLHVGPPETVSYRVVKLVHNPKIELAGMTAEQLIAELTAPKAE